jgi:putative hydrolase of HD superfamily
MEKSLIAAFKSMLTLQRWNLHPRVETWVEAESAALRAHWAYAIMMSASETGAPPKEVIHLLFRILLKPLNKHFMTDISVFVTKKLKTKAEWASVVNGSATDTAKLFPRDISEIVQRYLSYKGDYTKGWDKKWGEGMKDDVNKKTRTSIDDIIEFCKFRVQKRECEINNSIYPDKYRPFFEKEIIPKIKEKKYSSYCKIIEDDEKHPIKGYFETIAHLKYLRRWNTTNRFIPSSVLGHTYIVTILALMFSLTEAKEGDTIDFVHEALLRALFHDVPEAVTGDIITPVKNKINKEMGKETVENIEEELVAGFIDVAPAAVGKVIKKDGLDLFKKLTNKDVGKSVSLVKDCDRLALMLECLYEKEAGVVPPEMEESYHKCRRELSNSEWPSVRRFLSVLADQWQLSD